jgi:membrane glycosyltransferase
VALAVAAYAVSIPLFLWMSPVIIGLLLASPMAALSASAALGHATRSLGLLVTPEEVIPPDVVRRANELTSMLPSFERSWLWQELLIGPTLSTRHREMLPETSHQRFGEVNVDLVIGFSKLEQCSTLDDAFQILSSKELKELLSNRRAFDRLKALGRHEQPRRGAADDILTIS